MFLARLQLKTTWSDAIPCMAQHGSKNKGTSVCAKHQSVGGWSRRAGLLIYFVVIAKVHSRLCRKMTIPRLQTNINEYST